MNTLAVRLALPLAGCALDFNQPVSAPCRAHEAKNLAPQWRELIEKPIQHIGHRLPQLIVLPSTYRNFYRSFLDYLRKLGEEFPGRQIAVIIPELVERRWYHFLLHRRATLLKSSLLMKGGPEIVIITQPWYRKEKVA